MNYRRYPAYKPSGVEWLGEVPAHWEIMPLKHGTNIELSNVDKKTVDNQQSVYLCNYLDVYRNEFITADMSFMLASASDEQIERLTLEFGDVIITKDSEAPSDIGVPSFVAEPLTGVVCGYHLALIRPLVKIVDGRFLLRFFQSAFARARFAVEAVGLTRYGLSKSSITDIKILTPPLQEQRAIAAFLDRETAKIDALIARQEQLIAALHEKRQALISHAVTQGLNPHAPMKPSGVEWLGDVPAHWRIAKFASCLERIEAGWTPNAEQRLAEDDEWAVVKVGCIRNGDFYPDEHKTLAFGVIPDLTIEIKPGDLIMSRANTIELVGSIGLVKQTRPKLTLCDKTYRLILNDQMLSAYTNYLLQGSVARFQIELAANGASASMKNISQDSIRALLLPVPPVAEQQQITNYLEQAIGRIVKISKAAERAIALLRERRSALVSAAVTGKIDVRG